MKSLVLSLLLLSSSLSLGGIEYPSLIACYLDGMQMDNQEQHDRVERALLYLEGMDREDLVSVMGYLCMIPQVPDVEVEYNCDCCCDDLIEEVWVACAQENCA
jgi:hypothetical protein